MRMRCKLHIVNISYGILWLYAFGLIPAAIVTIGLAGSMVNYEETENSNLYSDFCNIIKENRKYTLTALIIWLTITILNIL